MYKTNKQRDIPMVDKFVPWAIPSKHKIYVERNLYEILQKGIQFQFFLYRASDTVFTTRLTQTGPQTTTLPCDCIWIVDYKTPRTTGCGIRVSTIICRITDRVIRELCILEGVLTCVPSLASPSSWRPWNFPAVFRCAFRVCWRWIKFRLKSTLISVQFMSNQ